MNHTHTHTHTHTENSISHIYWHALYISPALFSFGYFTEHRLQPTGTLDYCLHNKHTFNYMCLVEKETSFYRVFISRMIIYGHLYLQCCYSFFFISFFFFCFIFPSFIVKNVRVFVQIHGIYHSVNLRKRDRYWWGDYKIRLVHCFNIMRSWLQF